ncbi:hypothetical protein GQ54DRAFT_315039, partial [Martensiomyces pterosporus]
MVKCTLAFGLLAAALAATAVSAHDTQADVKTFSPALKIKPKFNVYNEPVT